MSGEHGLVEPGDIAVVGMALRVPGANDWRAFRRNVSEGVESIVTLTREELLAAGESEENLASPFYVPRWAGISDTEHFDAGFFSLSAREASVMDPQHRHFLEICVEALNDAALVPSSFSGQIGVFAASGYNAYFARHVLTHRELVDDMGFFLLRHTGNDKDFLPTRVSYALGLRGPSIAVQTACSSSLVAIHLAAQSLLMNECDAALAGGVTLELPLRRGYLYREGEILAPDGRCRAFDARSSGAVFGSGAGAVVLRRLEDALRDGDPIHAVLKGTAINNDGNAKVGYLAPSVEGQARCVVEALGVAGISPDEIGFMECHGTGTPVGDPIEVSGLASAFRQGTKRKAFCAIGSVKPNIGHLDTAAGVVSFIKAALAVRFGEVPPLVHFERPNPALELTESPFYARASAHAWPLPGPRRAGVNSLGVGGTNAHAILQEPPPRSASGSGRRFQLFTWSAHSEAAADRLGERLARADGSEDVADLANTLAMSRERYPHRRALAARDLAGISRTMRAPAEIERALFEGEPSRIVFAFAGGGAAHPNMGRDLYAHEAVYRRELDSCLDSLESELRADVRRALLPSAEDLDWARDAMERARIQLPAQTATQLAMAALLASFDVRPSLCIGHSLGEYACAHLAGVMSREETLRLVARRGALFDTLDEGGMLGLVAGEDEARAWVREFGGPLDIAVVNGERSVVVSGLVGELERFEAFLSERDVDHVRLRIRVAAHSPMLEPILAPFRETLEEIALSPPRADGPRFVSNLTGAVAGPEVASTEYWVQHLRKTVRYADGVKLLFEEPKTIVVDVGPGRTQASLLGERAQAAGGAVVAAMRHPKESVEDDRQLVHALGALWTHGAFEAARYWKGETRRRVHAPVYAFDRARHWIDPATSPATEVQAEPPVDPLRELPLERWFSRVAFRPAEITEGVGIRRVSWFGALSTAWESALAEVALERSDELDPAAVDRLAQDAPDLVVLSIESKTEAQSDPYEPFERVVRQLSAAIGASEGLPPIVVITQGGIRAGEGEEADPTLAKILGPVLVAPKEAPGLVVRWLDVDAASVGSELLLGLSGAVSSSQPRLALRRGRLIEKILVPLELSLRDAPPVGSGDVVLITGGTRGIGYEVARACAAAGASVVVCGRSPMAQGERARLVGTGEILALQGDVGEAADVSEWVRRARALGRLRLVVHAAGAIDDQPMLAKSPAHREAILRPKVKGAAHLLAAIGASDDAPQIVFFSSTSGALGPPGQVDYVAANAALKAYAYRDERVRVIAWGMWREVGMLRRSLGAEDGARHPFAPWPAEDGHAQRQLSTSDWVLDEHRLASGATVLPGTAYLEMLRVGLSSDEEFRPCAWEEIELVSPLLPRPGRPVQVAVEREGDVLSVTSAGPAGGRRHVRAKVSEPAPRPGAYDVEEIRGRCGERVFDEATHGPWRQQEGAVRFGPRWQLVREARLGDGEAIARLALGPRFAGDLETVGIHPAILDLATAFVLGLFTQGPPEQGADRSVLVPVGYDRFESWASMPAEVFSIVRLREPKAGFDLYLDVDIVDGAGAPIARATGFAMKRIPQTMLDLGDPGEGGDLSLPELGLERGITVADGMRALWSFLASDERLVFASSLELGALAQRLAPKVIERVARAEGGAKGAQPRDEVERTIAEAFGSLLGHASVHLDQDFFSLGGHSLLAVRLFNRIKRELGADLPLALLFEASTVRALAERVRGGPLQASADEATPTSEAPSVTPVASFQSLVPIRRAGSGGPFFCVHGAGGNVLNFLELSRKLATNRPMYGLQARGVDGETQPHDSIEAMARDYLAEIRGVQAEGPYVLGGYSGGGVVALEMARQLTASGQEVAALVLLDSYVPGLSPRRTSVGERLRGLASEGLPYVRKAWRHALTRRMQAWLERTRLEEALTTSTAVPFDLREAWLTRNFLHVSKPYRVEPWGGRAVLYRAEVTDPYFGFVGFELGWKGLLPKLEVEVVPGDHDTLILEPNVKVLASKLDGLLAELA